MKYKAKTLDIKRAREQKIMRNFYYGFYLPMLEGMVVSRQDLRNNKYY